MYLSLFVGACVCVCVRLLGKCSLYNICFAFFLLVLWKFRASCCCLCSLTWVRCNAFKSEAPPIRWWHNRRDLRRKLNYEHLNTSKRTSNFVESKGVGVLRAFCGVALPYICVHSLLFGTQAHMYVCMCACICVCTWKCLWVGVRMHFYVYYPLI